MSGKQPRIIKRKGVKNQHIKERTPDAIGITNVIGIANVPLKIKTVVVNSDWTKRNWY